MRLESRAFGDLHVTDGLELPWQEIPQRDVGHNAQTDLHGQIRLDRPIGLPAARLPLTSHWMHMDHGISYRG